jgi:hypothetical protein
MGVGTETPKVMFLVLFCITPPRGQRKSEARCALRRPRDLNRGAVASLGSVPPAPDCGSLMFELGRIPEAIQLSNVESRMPKE